MKLYEINLHLSGKLDDKEVTGFWEELKKKIAKTKIKILKETPLKKISLAYPLERQNYVFNGCLFVEAQPEEIKNCEKSLTIDNNILRFLILKRNSVPFKFLDNPIVKEKVKTKSVKQSAKQSTKTTKKTAHKTLLKKGPKKAKIKLEDIDKSLEKLLEKEI